MKLKQFFGVIVVLFIFSSLCYGITRNQVVQSALDWEYTTNWTPQIDTVIFGTPPNSHTFQSNFLTSANGGTPPYNVEAYVYGGEDSETNFISRINNGECLGGNNVFPGGHNTKWFYDNGYNPQSRLAGIDCSAFVSACWSVARTNTTGLANMSLQLSNRDELKLGDILDDTGSHVILVLTQPASGNIDTAESTPPNVVVRRGRLLSSIGSNYGAYTPFPIFSDWSPSEGESVTDATPEIKVTIKSQKNIKASSIKMKIDGNLVSPTLSPSTDTPTINVSYTPTSDLSEGEHTVYIYAKNSLDFEDEVEHRFQISTPAIYTMDFEDGTDGAVIRSRIPGLTFSTTQGYDWIYGDIRTGRYNVDPYGSRAYKCNGNFFAWLGPNQGKGRIDFTGSTAKSVSFAYSSYATVYLEAYDSHGTLIDSDSGPGNLNTGRLDRLKVSGANISYVLVHDAGNYWLVDDLIVEDLLRETTAQFLPPDFERALETLDTINIGSPKQIKLANSTPQNFKIILNWTGSEMKLEAYKPDATLYGQWQYSTPPIIVDIPVAEAGEWKFVVTAINIPFADYPFALVVGTKPAPAELPNLRAINYNFGEPEPGFNMDNFPIYRYWMNVQIENIGQGDAFNVTASISSGPPNGTIIDGNVTVGNIPAGSSAWSSDTYTIELDLSQPGPGADQGITWRIEYDDSGGGHHVVENVPEFPPASPSLSRRAQWFVVIPQPKLYQNYPNPWNPETWIPYQIASPSDVRIRIYNLKGQLVKTLDLGPQLPGFYIGKAKAAYWNGRNEAGETVSSGIYFYQIQAGKFNAIKKMVMLK